MATTQATSTRTLLTGIAVLLAGCLALAGAAQAEVESASIAIAVDPAINQMAEPIPAVWTADAPRFTAKYPETQWTEIFGQPSHAPIVQPASFTPVPVVAPPPVTQSIRPVAAYRVRINKHVRHFLERFQTGYRREVVEGWLARSGRYLPMILDVFRQKGLPDELVFTAMIESGFNPTAVSHAGAKGLWQFMAPTARLYGLRVDSWLDERMDPEKSTVAAANYLRDLYTQFGSWDLAQAAYNAGDARVQQAITRTGSRDFWTLHRTSLLMEETKNFVPAIHAATLISLSPERYGFTVVPDEPLRYEEVAVPRSTRLARLAALSGVPLPALEALNPELRQKQTPPDGPYTLKVPVGAVAAVHAALEIDASTPRIASASHAGVHVVQAGDTVSRIASRYGVSVKLLVKWNALDRPDRIFPGERLRVSMPATS